MFTTASEVLGHYIDSSENITAVELIAQPSPDEFYYLCTAGSDVYAVYQTDHPTSLPVVAQEIEAIVADSYKLAYWLVRRDRRAIFGDSQPLDVAIEDKDGAIPDLINALFYSLPDSYWRYAVLELDK